jgi:hypothetical protein
MTRDEWQGATEPQAMLTWLRESGKLSERNARLFSVAVCRRIWPLLTDERSRRAVDAAEAYADGLPGIEEGRRAAADAVIAACAAEDTLMMSRIMERPETEGKATPADWHAHSVTEAAQAANHTIRAGGFDASDWVLWSVNKALWYTTMVERGVYVSWSAAEGVRRKHGRVYASLLRDLVNPFGSGVLDPACRTPEVLDLATAIYQDRSFDQLPELANALVRIGRQADAELLAHLKGPGPHCRGCWAPDLILAKG